MSRSKINKEKEGITVRFSIRLPKEIHKYLKEKSLRLDTSMNDLLIEAIKREM